MPLETPAHQNADFFRAILPFQPDLDLDWLLALTCTAIKSALADVRPAGFQITTRYRSVVTSPERCAQAIALGCAPAKLFRPAASAGALTTLGYLCDTYPELTPPGLVACTADYGHPRTKSDTIAWLHARGHPLPCMLRGRVDEYWVTPALLNILVEGLEEPLQPNWAKNVIASRPYEYVLETFKPGSPAAGAFPAGPRGWVQALFERYWGQPRPLHGQLQTFCGLGWDMGEVPLYASIYGHVEVLDWLRGTPVLRGVLARCDIAQLRQDAAIRRGQNVGRRAGQAADKWLEAYEADSAR